MGVVSTRVGEQVADQSLECIRTGFGPLEVDGGVAESGADSLQVSAQRKQRRAQIVGNAGDEEPSRLVCLGPLLGVLAERGRHALDGLRDVGDLADPAPR